MIAVIRVFCLSLMLLVGMGVPAEQAEAAKRFGSGGSFGQFFATPKKVAPAPKPAAAPTSSSNKAGNAGAATAKPAMGGMLGGLLAGGLLGALLFGGAFEGIQFMDILLIGLVVFAIFSLLGRFHQPAATQPRAAAGPEYPAYETSPDTAQEVPRAFQTDSLFQGGLAEAKLEYPAWFNKDAFLEGGKSHFATLQDAWNRNDLELIRSYCHPEFYQLLKQDRARYGDVTLNNEVVSVMAEVVGFEEYQGRAELSINFYGWMREDGAETSEFNEIWHLTRDLRSEGADWYLVGIEQPH